MQQGRDTDVIADLACCAEKADLTSVGVGHSVQLRDYFALVGPISRPRPPFYPQARGRAVRFEIGRIDHHRSVRGCATGPALHHPDEDAQRTLPLPAIVKGLMCVWGGGIDRRRVTPAMAGSIDEDDLAQHPAIIHPGLAGALGKCGRSRTY